MANDKQEVVEQPSNAELMALIKGLQQQNDALTLQAASAPKKKQTTTVKINSKGGIFFSAPSMKAFSEAKNKEYQVGMNIHAYQLQGFHAFLKDAKLVKQVLDCIETTVQTA